MIDLASGAAVRGPGREWIVPLCLLAMAGCGGEAMRPDAWERVDLWTHPPRLDWVPPEASRLGSPILLRLAPVTAPPARARTYRSTPSVRVIDTRPGVRLAWSLELGTSPYFSFLPLPGQAPDPAARVGDPDEQGPVGAPDQQGPVGAPDEQGPLGAPDEQGPVGAPDQHGPAGAPDQHGPAGAPDQHGPAGAPDQHGPAGAPDQHGPVGAPDEKAPVSAPEQTASPCTYLYRVGVHPEGEELQEIFNHELEPRPGPSGATLVVDLGPWAGRRVELLGQVDRVAGSCPPELEDLPDRDRVLWASPAVYSRVEVPEPRRGRPNVLLVTADTLRADALGAYGQRPSVTPALDRLAAESDLWLEAFSSFNVTNPSLASLMTGRYGKDHGVYGFSTPLAPGATTLAEVLSEAGYESRAILSVQHLAPRLSGLGQGFDAVDVSRDQFAAELAVDMALDWLGTRRSSFFLWLHLFDPHTPHTPPRPFSQGLAAARASGLDPVAEWSRFREPGRLRLRNRRLGAHEELYRGEVAYLDRQLDRLLGFVESRGLLEHTLVVFVADHGENLDDHGIQFRHAGLWDTTTHVPLIIRWPGPSRPGRRLSGLVQNVDLFPTILRAVGLEPPPQDGRDLAAATGRGRRAVFAEHAERQGLMIRTGDHLLMRMQGSRFVADGTYFYDLRQDPEQRHNLSGQGLAREAEMAAELERWIETKTGSGAAPVPVELGEEEKERLRALGYL